MSREADALPFAQVPHWVMLAPISPEAQRLYVLLVMHVNREDPANRRAWPTRASLAALAGYSRPQSVDRYIAELEQLGAVTVERGRHPDQPLRKRNFYEIKLAGDPAPSGCRVLSLSEWYKRAKAETAGQPGGAPQRTSGAADESEGCAEPSEVRPSAPREVRSSAPPEVRPAAQELEVVDRDQGEEEQSLPVLLPRAGAACEYALCRGGVLKIGINERPCPKCSRAA